MALRNWKEKIYLLLKKAPIDNSNTNHMLWIFYKLYTKVYSFIKYSDAYFFRSVAIEISTFCNRTCYYCPNSIEETPVDFMTEKTFNKIIAQLKEINYSGVILYHFYNEPLLDKRLPSFIRHVKKNLPNCVSRIVSNGDFLSVELADNLIDAGVLDIMITIHDIDGENILNKLGPVLKKYPEYIHINSIHDKPISNRGGAIKVKHFDKKDTCTDPLTSLTLDHNGNVILCCNDYYRKHSFGNITHDRIPEIWHGKDFSRLRKELRNGISNLEICRKCMGRE
jgi:cyclic pyranopterin phosphate synthase